jgi:DNA (cytosine-5)-methyltransferase 1
MKPIKVIDLFAGPGGLGEGFASIGPDAEPTFDIVVSVEKEPSAHATLTLRSFTRKFPNRTLPRKYYQYLRGEITREKLIAAFPREWEEALKETLGRPVALGEDNELIYSTINDALGDNIDPWVLIGGPPCQAYSIAARAKNQGNDSYIAAEDERHFLYKEYLEIIEKFKPAVFIMENVKGMLSSSPTGRPIFEQIVSDLRNPHQGDLSYEIFPMRNTDQKSISSGNNFIIKAEEYGVPQARHRVILLGVRTDIPADYSKIGLQKSPPVSVGQALICMPKLRSGLSKGEDSYSKWNKVSESALNNSAALLNIDLNKIIKGASPKTRGKRFLRRKKTLSKNLPEHLRTWLADEQLGGIIQHETRSHIKSDIERYAYVSLFGCRYSRSPRIPEFPKDLLPNHKNIHSGKFVDRFRILVRNDPSKTITSHIAKDSHAFIHFDPIQSRGLTVREAARLQTFPENYFFEGGRTQQYIQVGNAVPPFLARQIGQIVKKIITI